MGSPEISRTAIIQSLLEAAQVKTATRCTPGAMPRRGCAVLLRRGEQVLLALHDTRRRLDLAALERELGEGLRPARPEECAEAMFMHRPGAGALLLAVDLDVRADETVELVEAEHRLYLPAAALLGTPAARRGHFTHARAPGPAAGLDARLQRLEQLPGPPQLARRLLLLRGNPHATVAGLCTVVEEDAAIAAQVMRVANSAHYGAGAVATLEAAVLRVLGFEAVLHIAMGMAVRSGLELPQDGPLGAQRLTRDAIYTAAVAEHLAAALPRRRRPVPGSAYLAGLLHDIGYLAMAQLFRSEYFWLNKLLQAHREAAPLDIECRLLGTDHADLGGRLCAAWSLPAAVIAVAHHHHDPDYAGEQADAVRLVQVAERLLASQGLGASGPDELPEALLSALGLEEEQVLERFSEVLADRLNIEAMVAAGTA